MCSEAVWWRCHRRIIADYLLHAGRPVIHLMARGRSQLAKMTGVAVADGPILRYPQDFRCERLVTIRICLRDLTSASANLDILAERA